MGAENVFPKLRKVDIFPAEVSGQKVICLRDPLNLSENVLFIPYPIFFIIQLFDGQHSVVDIQAEYMRRFGEILYRESILGLINQLEEHFFLDSERSRKREGEIIEAFKKSPTRPMALAGEAYDADRAKLQQTLEAYFGEPEGPGLPTRHNEPKRLVGAIAPHIDYRRGGCCYAWAHKTIQESSPVDLFIILGTAHSPTQKFFALTGKDFQTPWGPVESDRAFLAEIQARCSIDFFEDEFVHKAEHSIELQLVFLRALWRQKNPFQIVPVLCGSFHEAILQNISPLELPGVAQFIEALKTAIARSERRVCLLASADLAHVGLRFGDAKAPNRFTLQSLDEDDRRLLEYAQRVDAEGFYDSLRREKDRRRVCGLPPIYTLLQVVDAQEGKLLKYGQSLDSATQSAVTFASLAFYAGAPIPK
jgi:AmmeMemoRadiSam system protein B